MKKMCYGNICMFLVFSMLFVSSCGNDDDEPQDIQSSATLEYLLSMWNFLPDEGIKTGDIYEEFFFGRVVGKTVCTITRVRKGEKKDEYTEIGKDHYNFTYNAPQVTLTDEKGQIMRTLTVYKLNRNNSYSYLSDRWLLIDGKKYNGSFTGDISF
ncbi:MAG: hypothetical protein Q4E32_05330 [Bacteroidales bacterium]|nr:hypothetical protein [Bacteroidales bacterium]